MPALVWRGMNAMPVAVVGEIFVALGAAFIVAGLWTLWNARRKERSSEAQED